ncbi:DUF4384 domain-containing protein [Calidithermus chliarophilus]|uniref:DUF4384 domain-containing protein n=1 Tax=Calidithermus chliarophilus TaxID=52023 RepID=UPI000401EBBD|nr:DUF4384 domain-containing protein [Calidithermus chliarophilus]
MKTPFRIAFALLLVSLLSACTLYVRSASVGVGFGVNLDRVITRLEPDRGTGASYRPGDRIRFIITLTQPGYVTLVSTEASGYSNTLGTYYLDAGTTILPPPGQGVGYYQVAYDSPSGVERIRAIYTNTRPSGSVRIEGRFSNDEFNNQVRIYFERNIAQARDVADSYFYVTR